MANAKRDNNQITTLLGVSNVDGVTPVVLWADPITHRLLVDTGSVSSGTVTSVSVVTANGVSGSVANPTTTPAITITLGAITPSSVNGVVISGSSTPTLAVTGTTTVSGSNTGDQTSIVGITGTKAQFDTAVTDGNILYVGDVTQYTDEMAQDAVGVMVNSTLTYVDVTPSLGINLSNANTWAADQSVPAESYGSGWDSSNEVPTKNDIYDKIESLTGASTATILGTIQAQTLGMVNL